jgi:hypothetical protein
VNSIHRNVLCLVVGVVAGLLLAGLLSGTGAAAQSVNQAEPSKAPMITRAGELPRYQVSAYAGAGASGCYITDTATGETWHASKHDNSARRVCEKLMR